MVGTKGKFKKNMNVKIQSNIPMVKTTKSLDWIILT